MDLKWSNLTLVWKPKGQRPRWALTFKIWRPLFLKNYVKLLFEAVESLQFLIDIKVFESTFNIVLPQICFYFDEAMLTVISSIFSHFFWYCTEIVLSWVNRENFAGIDFFRENSFDETADLLLRAKPARNGTLHFI